MNPSLLRTASERHQKFWSPIAFAVVGWVETDIRFSRASGNGTASRAVYFWRSRPFMLQHFSQVNPTPF